MVLKVTLEYSMKKLTVIAFALIAGCDTEVVSQSSKRDGPIVLECTGEKISETPKERKQVSYLIKLEDQPVQPSLTFYSDSERRFLASTCFRKYEKCQATLDPDMITEYGLLRSSDGGKILMTTKTFINRRTGEMRIVVSDSVYGEKTSFEGQCTKGELPTETPQKF